MKIFIEFSTGRQKLVLVFVSISLSWSLDTFLMSFKFPMHAFTLDQFYFLYNYHTYLFPGFLEVIAGFLQVYIKRMFYVWEGKREIIYNRTFKKVPKTIGE